MFSREEAEDVGREMDTWHPRRQPQISYEAGDIKRAGDERGITPSLLCHLCIHRTYLHAPQRPLPGVVRVQKAKFRNKTISSTS